MFFQIDPDGGLAIYEQVVRQVTFAVAGGALRPGDLVPSVRELARQLAINPNTVARAYRQLQDQEVLESVRGMGLAVAPRAVKQCRGQRLRLLRERLRQVLVEAVPEPISVLEAARDAVARMALGKWRQLHPTA